jgi:hypothetical protein
MPIDEAMLRRSLNVLEAQGLLRLERRPARRDDLGRLAHQNTISSMDSSM